MVMVSRTPAGSAPAGSAAGAAASGPGAATAGRRPVAVDVNVDTGANGPLVLLLLLLLLLLVWFRIDSWV